jgi:hypothetical protein
MQKVSPCLEGLGEDGELAGARFKKAMTLAVPSPSQWSAQEAVSLDVAPLARLAHAGERRYRDKVERKGLDSDGLS